MAKLIIAVDIPDHEALKIEAQARDYEEKGEVTVDSDGIPTGYFNPDGMIVLDGTDFEEDKYDSNFFLFEYRGIERD